jgi:hypothetical protein
MSPPNRWVRSDSEVEPVLRAVMRYAQSQAPTHAQIAKITQRVLAHAPSSPPPKRFFWRRPSAFASMLLVLLVGGGAFGAWAVVKVQRSRGASSPPAPSVSSMPRVPVARAGTNRPRAAQTSDQPTPAPRPSANPVDQQRGVGSMPSQSAPAVSTRPDAGRAQPGDEIALLQHARRLVSSDPVAALALTMQHETAYPRSNFGEERSALQIEALFRAGHRAQAAQRFSEFERRYPRSAYLRRMAPWFQANRFPDAPDAAQR